MTFTLCKARIIYSALLLLNYAIARLGEKALGSGGKSEDQPLSERMPLHHDVWCNLAQADFVDVNSFLTQGSQRVLLYKFTGAACRETNLLLSNRIKK